MENYGNAFDKFNEDQKENNSKKNTKKIINSENKELIERVDKVLITESGKYLLND